MTIRTAIALSTIVAGFAGALSGATLTPAEVEFFEQKIRPILAEHCYECHNSVDKKKGDLALDYRDAVLEGEVIVPGDPDKSPLIIAIRHEGDDYEPMPSKAPQLANVIIKNFEEWVRMGAPDPRTEKPTKVDLERQVDWETVRERRQEWWAFQALRKTAAPRADDQEWDGNEIDRFVHAGLQAQNLVPQNVASPETLVRRVHLILTGLPPSPGVVAHFVADPSMAAYEGMVDGLLALPAYGERWARYWMDWYRYAETHGSEGDPPVPYATQYRDYLIRAINADVPYDQLIREHLAGDLLAHPRINEGLGLNESAIGPGHFRMVPHGFGVTDAYGEQVTFTDNQVDVVSKAMMGLTVSCARCHNHKFDPISQRDYYKFYGIMISSRPAVVNVDAPALQDLHRQELAALKEEIRKGFSVHWLGQVDEAIRRLEGGKFEKTAETDPLAGWALLKDLDEEGLTKKLGDLRDKHLATLEDNEKAKAAATFYADLRDPETYKEWFRNGNGLGAAPSPAGSFAISVEGAKAITGIYPAGVYSHLISDKHNATLSSAFHLAKGSKAAVRVIGSKAVSRFVVRSYALSHGGLHPAPEMKPTLGWVGLGKYDYWNGDQGYFQFATGPDSTNRPGGGRSWFGALEVYAGDEGLREVGAPIVSLPGAMEAITDRASLLEFYRKSLREAVVAWREGALNDERALFLDAFVSRGFLSHELAGLPEGLRAQVDRYRRLEGEIRIPQRAPGVMEGEIWDQPLLTRGDYKKEEEPVERAFLEAFGGERYSKSESGRRELAEDILREDNPLTSRVIVNRLWNHVFGRGLVASADNFGRLGKEPSHPALLDSLAIDFRNGGWAMKPFVKQLVMSRTFRSDSASPAANGVRDPENLQLAHFTPRRLEAEAILDTINAVAKGGGVQRAMFRPVIRNRLDPFLSTFNFPVPITTVGDRDLTNVPAQALALMNGKEVEQAAREWSGRVVRERATPEARVELLFLQAYARLPSPEERAACLAYLEGKAPDESGPLRVKHAEQSAELVALNKERAEMLAPVRATLQLEVDERNAAATRDRKSVDLKPIGRWDFTGDARDAVGGMDGVLHGEAKIEDGALVLAGGCMMTPPLPQNLGEKTLEVLVQMDPITQRAGGAMTVQLLDGGVFDSVVFAERDAGEWMAGSNGFARTEPFGGAREEEAGERPVRIVIVYHGDGRIEGYRDGKRYGKSYRKSALQRYGEGQAQVVFGLRHGGEPQVGRMLTGRIFEARLYDRALTAEEVLTAESGFVMEVVNSGMVEKALSDSQRNQLVALDAKIASLTAAIAELDRQLAARDGAQAASGDAYYRLAHALLNSKELIYVH